MREGIEGDLGGVDEPSAYFGGNGANEDAMGRAGDEIADALVAGEQGHGVAVGFPGFNGREDLVWLVIPFDGHHVGVEGALPCGAATAESGFRAGGFATRPWFEGGGGVVRVVSDVEEPFFEGFCGHGNFSCE